MDTPFPGMDPYLEEPAMWPDVHHALIASIRDQLQSNLSSAYRAVITPYAAFESIEITPVRHVVPDVAILEREPFARGGSAAIALETAPLTLPVTMVVPVEYARIEIRTVRDQVLVTAIELLSPANKRAGKSGADEYEEKRQEIFSSKVHLLEIDLLRLGVRPRVARPLPPASYFIFLSRVQHRPHIEIWPLSIREAIKPVPVPLRYPDQPVALNLTEAIHETYRRARYDLDIDYREPPPAPDLSDEDSAWLDAFLRERGIRR